MKAVSILCALVGVAAADFWTDVVLPSVMPLVMPGRKDSAKKSLPGPEHDDQHSFREIAEENGYTYEQFNVTTGDGYILWVDRVLPKNITAENKKSMKAPVVLLQHGIEDVSIQWVANSADKAFAFMLADAGYDVWLGNNRGNRYSKMHTVLDPTKAAYWDNVDFELMGTEDLPAIIDFALQETKETNPIDRLAAYIGHSEGTTQFFIGQSMMPDYFHGRVNLYVALAPVVRLDHAGLDTIGAVSDQLASLMQLLGIYDFIDFKDKTGALQYLCKAFPTTCEWVDEGIWDYDASVDNTQREFVKLANCPAGAGWKNLIHYAQIARSKRFQRWDYGKDEN